VDIIRTPIGTALPALLSALTADLPE
jgi:hypothetical protein